MEQQQGRYALRTFEGFGIGDHNTAHDSLESAIVGFIEAPDFKVPRVVEGDKTLIERDPEAGMATVFWSAHAEAMYRWVECATILARLRPRIQVRDSQGDLNRKARRCANPGCRKPMEGLPRGLEFCCLPCVVAGRKKKTWKLMARDFDALAPHVLRDLNVKEAVRLVLVRRKSAAQASAIIGISVQSVEQATAQFLERLKESLREPGTAHAVAELDSQ